MSNHPNRGPKGPQSNPTPAEIKALRASYDLTQAQMAPIIMYSLPGYIKFENGQNRMHPIIWWALLERIKKAQAFNG